MDDGIFLGIYFERLQSLKTLEEMKRNLPKLPEDCYVTGRTFNTIVRRIIEHAAKRSCGRGEDIPGHKDSVD